MDPKFLEVLSSFLQIVLLAVAPILAGYLAAWVKAKIAVAKAELADHEPELMYWLEFAARLAVDATEASGLGGFITDKKAWAIDIAEKVLAEKGIKIDIDVLDAAIEQAWLEEFGQEKLKAAKEL